MSSSYTPVFLRQRLPADIVQRFRRCLGEVTPTGPIGDERFIFFRADDVGVPSLKFRRLIQLFRRHQVPLTLAVVPSWLTRVRKEQLLDLCGDDTAIWGWVQHGWRHFNHEPEGKRQEFGPSRAFAQKRKDLSGGFVRLKTLLGDRLTPAFVPPWNRCDQETLSALVDLGYKAISRSPGAQPTSVATLPDYQVSVDLHTRKEKCAESGWQNLFKELVTNLSNGLCGVMIHHQQMNDIAYNFLDLLLTELREWNRARFVHLGTLVEEGYGRKA